METHKVLDMINNDLVNVCIIVTRETLSLPFQYKISDATASRSQDAVQHSHLLADITEQAFGVVFNRVKLSSAAALAARKDVVALHVSQRKHVASWHGGIV